MKKSNLINAEIVSSVASIGHTEYMIICDAGLPIPKGVNLIDVSVSGGVPSLTQVLASVEKELVIDKIILAEETKIINRSVYDEIQKIIGHYPGETCSHEMLKEKSKVAHTIIRTGEVSPYANIILVAGVNF